MAKILFCFLVLTHCKWKQIIVSPVTILARIHTVVFFSVEVGPLLVRISRFVAPDYQCPRAKVMEENHLPKERALASAKVRMMSYPSHGSGKVRAARPQFQFPQEREMMIKLPNLVVRNGHEEL